MTTNLPDGINTFLAGAGWGDGVIEPLPGDASFRRYFRIDDAQGGSHIVMDAPPSVENSEPFVRIARLLASAGLAKG